MTSVAYTRAEGLAPDNGGFGSVRVTAAAYTRGDEDVSGNGGSGSMRVTAVEYTLDDGLAIVHSAIAVGVYVPAETVNT